MQVTIQNHGEKVLARLHAELPELEIASNETLESGVMMCELRHVDPECALAEKLFYAAVAENTVLLEMRNEHVSLEDVFRKLTGGKS